MKTAPIVGLPPAGYMSLAGFSRPEPAPLAAAGQPGRPAGSAAEAVAAGQPAPFDAPATRLTLSGPARERQEREALLRDVIDRNLTLDPELREVVYQAVDTRSGEVVFQLPNESALKMRIYTRTIASEPTIRSSEAPAGIARQI